jgi:hypothetical protein
MALSGEAAKAATALPILSMQPRRMSPRRRCDEEIKEAIAMAAIVRHWSTMLNGSQVDFATFKQQTDGVFAAVKAKSQ